MPAVAQSTGPEGVEPSLWVLETQVLPITLRSQKKKKLPFFYYNKAKFCVNRIVKGFFKYTILLIGYSRNPPEPGRAGQSVYFRMVLICASHNSFVEKNVWNILELRSPSTLISNSILGLPFP